jgi:hypothetical protein
MKQCIKCRNIEVIKGSCNCIYTKTKHKHLICVYCGYSWLDYEDIRRK